MYILTHKLCVSIGLPFDGTPHALLIILLSGVWAAVPSTREVSDAHAECLHKCKHNNKDVIGMSGSLDICGMNSWKIKVNDHWLHFMYAPTYNYDERKYFSFHEPCIVIFQMCVHNRTETFSSKSQYISVFICIFICIYLVVRYQIDCYY